MKELSSTDIQKLQENKKVVLVESSTRNPGLFRYLSTNNSLQDRMLLSDPMSNTYVQLINNDGTLDVVSQYLHAKNLTIDGLSVFNNATVQSNLKSKGNLETNHLITNGSVTMKNVTVVENLQLSGNLLGNDSLLVGSKEQLDIIFSSKETIGITSNVVGIESSMFSLNSNLITIGNQDDSEIRIGTTGVNQKITIGSVDSIVTIFGTMNYVSVENTKVANKELFLNNAQGRKILVPVKDVGMYISNGLDEKAGYIKSDSELGNRYLFKPPFGNYVITTPKLSSNSTFVVSNDKGGVQVDSLYTTTIRSNQNYIGDLLEVGRNVSISKDRFDVASTITSSGSIQLQGDLLIKGESRLGVHTFGKDSRIQSDLTISGNTNHLSNVSISGSIFIEKDTNLKNTKIEGDLRIENDSIINGVLSVHKDACFTNSNVAISGTLGVNDVFNVDNQKVMMRQLEIGDLNVTQNGYVKRLLVEQLKISGTSALENLSISGFAKISNSLIVDKNANIGNLNVSGNANFNNSNVVIDGGLKITKRGVLVNGMSVFHHLLTLQNGLHVLAKGASITGDCKFNESNVTISGSFQLIGDSELRGNTKIQNGVTIGDSLLVSGDTYLQKTRMESLVVEKDVQLGSNLLVSGNGQLQGSSWIGGDLSVSGSESIEGKLEIGGDLWIKGKASLESSVNIIGDIDIGGDTKISKKLFVEEDGSIRNIEIRGSSVIGENLNVQDRFLVEKEKIQIYVPLETKNIQVKESMDVGNNIHIQKDLLVIGKSTLDNLEIQGDTSIGGSILLTGNIQMSGNIVCSTLENEKIKTGELDITNSLVVKDKITIGDQLENHLPALFHHDLAIQGSTTMLADLSLYGGLKVGKRSIFSNNVGIIKNLEVGENMSLGGNILVSGNGSMEMLDIKKNVEIGGNVVIGGEIKLGETVQIQKDQILVNNDPLATQTYVKNQLPIYKKVTLDGSLERMEDIESGEYTYIVNKEIIDHFDGLGAVNGQINCMVEDMDNNIYVGGLFKTVGNIESNYLAKWDRKTQSWITFGTRLVGQVQSLLVNSKNEVYIAGVFSTVWNTNLLKYDPLSDTFSPIDGFNGFIKAIAIDSEDNIYVGGLFEKVNNMIVNNLAKIDSKTNRIQGLGQLQNGIISSMMMDRMDLLYVVGGYKQIYRLDTVENNWSIIPGLFNNTIFTMNVDTRGDLYVGGRFTNIQLENEIVSCRSIVKYDTRNNKWIQLGDGLYPDVKSIVIDLYDTMYATTNTIQPLFKFIDNEWKEVQVQIEGQINSMLFDSYNHLYLGSNTLVGKYASNYNKTIKFYNTIKFIEKDRMINCRKIQFNSLTDTITIKFINHIGYIVYKSDNVQCLR